MYISSGIEVHFLTIIRSQLGDKSFVSCVVAFLKKNLACNKERQTFYAVVCCFYTDVFLARYFFSDSPESAKSHHIAVFISAFAGFWRRPCFYFDLARCGLGCAATPENDNE